MSLKDRVIRCMHPDVPSPELLDMIGVEEKVCSRPIDFSKHIIEYNNNTQAGVNFSGFLALDHVLELAQKILGNIHLDGFYVRSNAAVARDEGCMDSCGFHAKSNAPVAMDELVICMMRKIIPSRPISNLTLYLDSSASNMLRAIVFDADIDEVWLYGDELNDREYVILEKFLQQTKTVKSFGVHHIMVLDVVRFVNMLIMNSSITHLELYNVPETELIVELLRASHHPTLELIKVDGVEMTIKLEVSLNYLKLD